MAALDTTNRSKSKSSIKSKTSSISFVTNIGRKNDRDSELFRDKLKELIRDGNLSKYSSDIEKVQECTHDYYLRKRGPSGKLEVDHTFECQLLAASIVNVSGCHAVLSQIDVGSSRTRQPFVVQNLINPIFEVHNEHDGCLNLRLIDKTFNNMKGKAVTNWLKEKKQGASNELSIGRALEDMFKKNKATSEDCSENLIGLYEQELCRIRDPYCDAMKNAKSKDSKEASEKLEEVGDEVGKMFEALEITKSR